MTLVKWKKLFVKKKTTECVTFQPFGKLTAVKFYFLFFVLLFFFFYITHYACISDQMAGGICSEGAD